MHAFSFKRILGVAGLIALLTSIVVGAVVLKLRDSAFREADGRPHVGSAHREIFGVHPPI